MQWTNRRVDKNGLVVLTVLILTLVLLGALQAVYLLVVREQQAQLDKFKTEQKVNLSSSLVEAVRDCEKNGEAVNFGSPQFLEVYPSGERVKLELVKRMDSRGGICEWEAITSGSEGTVSVFVEEFSPPGGKNSELYQKDIFAGGGLAGKPLSSAISVEEGLVSDLIVSLEMNGYNKFRSLFLPTADELANFGLRDRLYYRTEDGTDNWKVAAKTIIKGNGVLVGETGIKIGDNSSNMGKMTLISGSGIGIGNNVNLDKVLLIAKKNISIGNNSTINGIIICGGIITIGEGFNYTPNRAVLEPFYSELYYQ